MMNRRDFVVGGATALAAASLVGLPVAHAAGGAAGPGKAPNYWCTWGVQMDVTGVRQPDAAKLDPETYTRVIEKYINEDALFGSDGWAKTYFPRIRGDLYLMVDGGWSTTYSFDVQ